MLAFQRDHEIGIRVQCSSSGSHWCLTMRSELECILTICTMARECWFSQAAANVVATVNCNRHDNAKELIILQI